MNKKLKNKWMNKYNLAKVYYKHYGNLEIPKNFKTLDGINYDEKGILLGTWIITQRRSYNGQGDNKITEEQIKLLEEVGMKWYARQSYDYIHQYEEIKDANKIRKQIEILNRVRSYLNTYDEETLPTKEEINKGMVKVLNRRNN